MKKEELDKLKQQARDLIKDDFSNQGTEYLATLHVLIQAKATENAANTIAESLDYVAREIKCYGETH